MYIQIGKKKYECKASTFTTQYGQDAVRVISADAPVAENGFLLLNSEEEVIADRSDFTYLYREEGTIKEYTAVAEEIVLAEGTQDPVPVNPISKALSNLNRRISDITPYIDTKKAYFGENEKVFYGVPNGVLTVNMDGEYTVERVEDRVFVRFERLTETKEITITVE